MNLAHAHHQVIHCLITNFFVRNLVSKKRRRLLVGGYDLDMSYITDHVLAMSFPAERMRAVYRNPLWQVKSVLDMRHQGHYKVYLVGISFHLFMFKLLKQSRDQSQYIFDHMYSLP